MRSTGTIWLDTVETDYVRDIGPYPILVVDKSPNEEVEEEKRADWLCRDEEVG